MRFDEKFTCKKFEFSDILTKWPITASKMSCHFQYCRKPDIWLTARMWQWHSVSIAYIASFLQMYFWHILQQLFRKTRTPYEPGSAKSRPRPIAIILALRLLADGIHGNNKKLRYREEHSASVVLSWCTLWHLSGDKQQINLQLINHLYETGHETYRIPRNNAK